MDWVLRILSGPNKDAEIELEAGEYIIGNHDDADLVLDNVAVQSQHFKLQLNDQVAQLEILEEGMPQYKETYLNGKPIASNTIDLEPISIISLADFHFVLASEDQALNDIAIPSTPPENAVASKLNAEQATENETQQSATRQTVSEYKSAPETAHQTERLPLRRLMKSALLALGCGIVVVTASAMMVVSKDASVSGSSSSTPITVNDSAVINRADVHQDALNQLLRDAGYETLTVIPSTHGSIVKGFINHSLDRENILSALPRGGQYDLQLTDLNQLKTAAEMTLAAYKIDTVVVKNGAEPGTLELSGQWPNESQWKKVLASMQKDLPLVTNWQNNVTIQKHYDIPPLEISSVNLGNTPFLLTRTGERLFIGNQIGNGFSIKDIDLRHVIIGKNSERVKVELVF